MILPTGAPMESRFALFEGSLSEVRSMVRAMTGDEQAEIAVWTPGHIFTAEGLLSEAPGHEHDPLAQMPAEQKLAE